MQKQNTGRHIAKRATAIALSVMTIAGATAALGVAPEYSPVAMTVSAATTAPKITSYSISDGTTTKSSTSMTVRPGVRITISLKVDGGSGPYTYKFETVKSTGGSMSSSPATGTYSFKTDSSDKKYTVKATVTDSEGSKTTKTFTITASFGKLVNKSSFSSLTAKVGDSKTPVITLVGSGGKGPYTYTINRSYNDQEHFKKVGEKTVADGKIQEKVTYQLPVFEDKAGVAGSYYYRVDLKDAFGNTSSVTKKITVADSVSKVSVGGTTPISAKPGDKSVVKVYAVGGRPNYKYKVYISEIGSDGNPVKDETTGEIFYTLIKSTKDVSADGKNGEVKSYDIQTASKPLAAGNYKLKVSVTDASGATASRESSFKVQWDTFNNASSITVANTVKPATVILAEDTVESCDQDSSSDKDVSYSVIRASAQGGSSNKGNYEYFYFICDKTNVADYKKLSPAELRKKSDVKEFKTNGDSIKTVNNVRIQAKQKYMSFSESNDLNKQYAVLAVAHDKKANLYSTLSKEFKVAYDALSVRSAASGTVQPTSSNYVIIGFNVDPSVVSKGSACVSLSATGGKPDYAIEKCAVTYRGAKQSESEAVTVTVYKASKDKKMGNVNIKKGQLYIKALTDKLDDNGIYTFTIKVKDALGKSVKITKTVNAVCTPVAGELSLSSTKITPSSYVTFADENVDLSRSVIVTAKNASGGHGTYLCTYELFKVGNDGKTLTKINRTKANADVKENGGDSLVVHKDRYYVHGLAAGQYKFRLTIKDAVIAKDSNSLAAYKKVNGKSYTPLVLEQDVTVEYDSLNVKLSLNSAKKDTSLSDIGYIIINQKTTKPGDRSISIKKTGGSGNYITSIKMKDPDGKKVTLRKAARGKLEITPTVDGKVTYAPEGTQYYYVNKTGTYRVEVTVTDKETKKSETTSMSFSFKIPDITFSKSHVKVGSANAKNLSVGDTSTTAKVNDKLTIQLSAFSGGNREYYDQTWYVRKEGESGRTILTMSVNPAGKKSKYSASEIKKMQFTYTPTKAGKYHFYVGLRDTDGHGNGQNGSLAGHKMFTVTVK